MMMTPWTSWEDELIPCLVPRLVKTFNIRYFDDSGTKTNVGFILNDLAVSQQRSPGELEFSRLSTFFIVHTMEDALVGPPQ